MSDTTPTLAEVLAASVTVAEAVEGTPLTERSVRRWIAEGRLPAYRVAGRLRILTADLDSLVERV
jgi:excisionase family DNA binding protein